MLPSFLSKQQGGSCYIKLYLLPQHFTNFINFLKDSTSKMNVTLNLDLVPFFCWEKVHQSLDGIQNSGQKGKHQQIVASPRESLVCSERQLLHPIIGKIRVHKNILYFSWILEYSGISIYLVNISGFSGILRFLKRTKLVTNFIILSNVSVLAVALTGYCIQ